MHISTASSYIMIFLLISMTLPNNFSGI
jgi:hypothetical protein